MVEHPQVFESCGPVAILYFGPEMIAQLPQPFEDGCSYNSETAAPP